MTAASCACRDLSRLVGLIDVPRTRHDGVPDFHLTKRPGCRSGFTRDYLKPAEESATLRLASKAAAAGGGGGGPCDFGGE